MVNRFVKLAVSNGMFFSLVYLRFRPEDNMSIVWHGFTAEPTYPPLKVPRNNRLRYRSFCFVFHILEQKDIIVVEIVVSRFL